MTLTVSQPSLLDILTIARDMSEEEVEQFRVASGVQDVTPELVTRSLVAYRGVEYVLLDDLGAPVTALGCFEVTTGVFQTWMLSRADAFDLHGKEITQITHKLLRAYLEIDGFNRIQTLASPSRRRACIWYQRQLGMHHDGTLRKFFPDGSDAALFSLVKEG